MTSRGKQPTQKQPTGSGWPRTLLYEGLGLILISVAIFLLLTLLSFHPDDPSFNQTGGDVVRNAAGLFGAYLADIMLQIFGYAAGGLVLLFVISGLQLFRNPGFGFWEKIVAILLLTVATSILSALLLEKGGGGLPSGPGGLLGLFGSETARRVLGPLGALVLLIPIVILGMMILVRFSLLAYWEALVGYWRRLRTPGSTQKKISPAEPVEPKIKPETRTEAKRRLEAEAKRAASAEGDLREEAVAKGRMETVAQRRQAVMEAGMKTNAEPTLDGFDEIEVEARIVPTATRPGLWTRWRRGVAAQVVHGLAVLLPLLRRLLVSFWQQARGRLLALWQLRKQKPVVSEAEPEFFPLRPELYREPTFDDSSEPERQASYVLREEEGGLRRGQEADQPMPGGADVGPVLPLAASQPVDNREQIVTRRVLSSPGEEGMEGPLAGGEGVPAAEKPQETQWRPNPVFLWPESARKSAAVSPEAVAEPQVVSVTRTQDLPSFDAFASLPEDRHALIQDMDTWEKEPVAAEFELPPFSLMVDPGPKKAGGPTREDLNLIARTLEQKLADFKIKGQIVDVLPGPVVTTFELDPAPGLRAAKVIGLADDLARSISVSSVRVVGNVPGKTVIGIEIPNEVRQTVYLKEILSSAAFRKIGSPLAVALGSDIFGNPVAGNLAKMPHLLVAGTTGSGKSVAVNAMICSILFSARPDEVRFLMVDPKMLELSIYEGIPHLLAPVVTDVNKAANLLKWAVGEMENRYRLMSELGVRNLAGYNERIVQCIEQDEQPTRRVKIGMDPETGRPVERDEPIPLDTKPLIVIVIDELADLMIQVGKEVEPAIARLAQMARAAGLHLVLATQRPSVDVITGLIKANFPTRLAFQVSSKIDSRTILDAMGADRLLGMGDGLFLPPGTSHLQRIHAPFVSDKEVHDLVRYLRSKGRPEYDLSVLAQRADGEEDEEGLLGGSGGEEQDELYEQAAQIVVRARKVSTSMVQRHFKIGYNRAARIVERMEAEGLVSPANGAGKREVLAPD